MVEHEGSPPQAGLTSGRLAETGRGGGWCRLWSAAEPATLDIDPCQAFD
jgi:hypothetical protein